jgi:hypothetical protein
MNFKSNINKIHFLLTEKFNQVELLEKANDKIGPYIEISIKEDVECKIKIKKNDLDKDIISFVYSSNPLLEESFQIERYTNINNFAETISDIILNKRFDSEYLDKLK